MNAAPFRRCGLVVKADARGAPTTLKAVLDCLQARGTPVVTDLDTQAAFTLDLPAVSLADFGEHCDLMIVVGGDGTLLRASRRVIADGLPVLGINLGRLGFMVDIAPDAAAATLHEVLDGAYVEERRGVLEAFRDEESLGLAINDVVLRHPEPVSMLEFATTTDARFISHHRADGLIIATPTGSTAYALSAGGPMLHPASDSVALVPICPHTLSDRPLILPASAQIEVRIAGRDGRGAMATLDGHSTVAIAPGGLVQVRPATTPLRLIHPAGYDWYAILRGKLNWGRDKPAE